MRNGFLEVLTATALLPVAIAAADKPWAELDPAPQGRFNAAVAELPDGRVLAVGGAENLFNDFFSELATSDIYDPESDSWTPGPPLPIAAHGMWAATLPSGEILVAGGWSFGVGLRADWPRADSFILDPDDLEAGWVATGPLPYGSWAPYSMNASVVLSDGKVLILGGIAPVGLAEGLSNLSAVFDPVSRTWDVTRDLGAAPVATVSGSGGTIERLQVFNFDFSALGPSSQIFRFIAGAPEAGFTAAHVGQYLQISGASQPANDGAFLILQWISSSEVVLFHPGGEDEALSAQASFSAGGRRPQTRMPHVTTTGVSLLLPDGRAFNAGGHAGCVDGACGDSPFTQLYDPSTGRWTDGARMPEVPGEDRASNGGPAIGPILAGARWSPAGALLDDGTVLVTGGTAFDSSTGNFVARTSAIVYHPSDGSWTLLPSRAHRTHHGGTTRVAWTGGRLLFVGARFPDRSSCELFDPSTGQFSSAPSYGSNDVDWFGSRVLQLSSGEILQIFGIRRMDGVGVGAILRYRP